MKWPSCHGHLKHMKLNLQHKFRENLFVKMSKCLYISNLTFINKFLVYSKSVHSLPHKSFTNQINHLLVYFKGHHACHGQYIKYRKLILQHNLDKILTIIYKCLQLSTSL